MSQPKTPADLLLPILPAGDVFAEKCPSRQILNHVTSRWGVLILIALLDDTYRFSQLRRRIGGVSERMLAQTLQSLESDGFVLRTAYPVVPPHVEYSLTPLGKEVSVRVKELAIWVEGNLDDILAAQQSSEQQSIKP
ncbi:winged helix-turn-helix transcriptional regulator [Pectobacterium odoriferum]|uniref:winged helix-turn-helix transcriptional regulator n=1 Tax=Pectobacterium odoriferum TaxID=78398 RepID=UPI000AEC7F6B|nr:helix-turn-helix domain-containing protein [Pectobacterium odoriferum]MBA0189503.1 helix-turn-helix transcriptional regulator [Pectobacterium odoriferum]